MYQFLVLMPTIYKYTIKTINKYEYTVITKIKIYIHHTLCFVSSLDAASLSRPQSVEDNILFFSSSQLSISLASKKNC